jgi:hypothetical protein
MKRSGWILSLPAFWAFVWLASPVFSENETTDAEVKITIPDTASGILQEIKTQETDLGKTIAAKKLTEVHHFAFAIRDLVSALPGKSTDLGADKLGKLQVNAKFVATLAGRLDTSGDAGNQTETEANFEKLQSILKQIRSLYPFKSD